MEQLTVCNFLLKIATFVAVNNSVTLGNASSFFVPLVEFFGKKEFKKIIFSHFASDNNKLQHTNKRGHTTHVSILLITKRRVPVSRVTCFFQKFIVMHRELTKYQCISTTCSLKHVLYGYIIAYV